MTAAALEPPTATVVGITKGIVRVLCPYCGDEHSHSRRPNRPGYFGPQRRAPGCGTFRTPDQRVTGYQFTIPN